MQSLSEGSTALQLTIKNTDVGAGFINLDYRGNLKVVIMNHNVDTHLHMEPGDRIAQFIMMRFETLSPRTLLMSMLLNEIMEVLEALVTVFFFFFLGCKKK